MRLKVAASLNQRISACAQASDDALLNGKLGGVGNGSRLVLTEVNDTSALGAALPSRIDHKVFLALTDGKANRAAQLAAKLFCDVGDTFKQAISHIVGNALQLGIIALDAANYCLTANAGKGS